MIQELSYIMIVIYPLAVCRKMSLKSIQNMRYYEYRVEAVVVQAAVNTVGQQWCQKAIVPLCWLPHPTPGLS